MAKVLHSAPKFASNEGVKDALSAALGDMLLSAKEEHGGEDGHTVRIGHHKIEKNEGDIARVAGLQCGERCFAALGGLNRVAEALRRLFENTALGRVVIDDQNATGHDAKTHSLRKHLQMQAPR